MDLSILITTRNSDRYINRCLDSIFNQEFDKEYEVIVVDCNSDDITMQILNNYKDKFNSIIKSPDNTDEENEINEKIKVISTDTSNLAVAANIGLAECKGSLIIRIDPCYTIDSESLNRMFNFLTDNEDYDMCLAHVNGKLIFKNVSHNEHDIDGIIRKFIRPEMLYCLMFRNNLNTLYNELWNGIEDYKLLTDTILSNKKVRCIGRNGIRYMNKDHSSLNNRLTIFNKINGVDIVKIDNRVNKVDRDNRNNRVNNREKLLLRTLNKLKNN